MSGINGKPYQGPHDLMGDQMTHRQDRVYVEAQCTCGEKFLASGRNEGRAREALFGKHLKHLREVGAIEIPPKVEYSWREGEDGIITRTSEILALDLPEGETERREALLESAQQFLRTLFRYEMDMEIWGDWLLFVLSELYSTSFDNNFKEGLETYREVLKRIRDEIDKWLAADIEIPDDLTDIV